MQFLLHSLLILQIPHLYIILVGGGPKVMSSMELIDRFFQNFRFFHLNFKKIEKRGKSKFLKVFESF